MKKAISIILVAVMVVSIFSGLQISSSAKTGRAASSLLHGDTFTMGCWPQSEVKDSSLLSSLNALSVKSYAYNYNYKSKKDENNNNDSMTFGDIAYGGEVYRKVVINQYRSEWTDSDYSNQSDNGYTTGNTYWFRWEPVEWRVLNMESDGVYVISDIILDSQPYNDICKDITWAECTLRTWLSQNFYQSAFSDNEKSRFLNYYHNNENSPWDSSISGGADTTDKVWILSYSDAINSSYGFSSSYSNCDSARIAMCSDYAKSQGIWVDYGNSDWWLRSPSYSSKRATGVLCDGRADGNGRVDDSGYGVRPVFKLNLSSFISSADPAEVSRIYTGKEVNEQSDFNDFDTFFSNWIVDNYDYIYSTEMPASELTKNASEENKLQNGFIQSMKHVFDGKTVEEAQKEFYDAVLYDLITNTYSMPNFNEYLKKDLAKISKDITDYAINKGFELLKPVNGAAKNELYEYLMDWLGVDKPFYELSYDVFSAITEGSDNAQECIEKISKYISLKQEAEKLQASLTAIRDNTDKQPLKQAVNQVLDSLSMSPGEIAAKVVKDETTSTVFESIIVDGFKHLFSTILKISIPVDEIKAFINITYSLNDIFFGTTVTSDQEIRLYFYAHIEKACRAGFANATNNYSASKSATDAHILVNCYEMYLRIYEHQIKECLNYADVFYNAGLFAGLKKLFAKGTYESATAWIDSFSYKATKLKEAKEEAYNAWGISTGTKKLVYLISFVNGQYAMCEKYYVDTGDSFYCNLSKFDKYMEKLFSLGLLKGQTLSFEGYYRDNELKNEFSGYLQAVNETSAVYVNYLLENKVTSPSGKPTGVKCAARTAAAEKITWNKASGISGYQVQLLTSSGKNAGLITTTATSYVFTKLVAGHAYKARVRFYNKDNSGKMYYGAWSTINSPTLPAGSGLTKLTPAKKAFTAQWKKVAVTGYQLQYATNAKFTKATTKTLKGAAKVKLAIKTPKGGTRYYVRVRTFKTIGGKNYYSTWSGAKAVVTKK